MIDVGDLPEDCRVKLPETESKRLWEKVEEEGASAVSEQTGFPRTRIYNWKSNESFLPVTFVQNLIGNFKFSEIKAGSNSTPVKLDLPMEPGDDLLTRIDTSVSVNREGTPVYRAKERSLVERFNSLLQQLGEVPTSVYSREAYELRYPKVVHAVLKKAEFSKDKAIEFDERGSFTDSRPVLDGEKLEIPDFEQRLYSTEKIYRLAVIQQDEETVKKVLSDSAGKASRIDF